MLFYATPVLYPIEAVPETFSDFLLLNPLTPAVRDWPGTGSSTPARRAPVDAAGGWDGLIAPVAIYLAICVLAVWVFNREAPRIAEEL